MKWTKIHVSQLGDTCTYTFSYSSRLTYLKTYIIQCNGIFICIWVKKAENEMKSFGGAEHFVEVKRRESALLSLCELFGLRKILLILSAI